MAGLATEIIERRGMCCFGDFGCTINLRIIVTNGRCCNRYWHRIYQLLKLQHRCNVLKRIHPLAYAQERYRWIEARCEARINALMAKDNVLFLGYEIDSLPFLFGFRNKPLTIKVIQAEVAI